ncbi:MAG TPA: GxxExxY protein [Gemmata sp.]
MAQLIVEQKAVIKLNSVECTAPVHTKQLLTYLRHTNCRPGLLRNCGAAL